MGLILLIIIVILLLGGLPQVGLHNAGYAPSGILMTILIIVLILWLLGRL
jgi:hypothetical protein